MIYTTEKCPHCGNTLKHYTGSKGLKIGDPNQECYYCHKEYIDRSYKPWITMTNFEKKRALAEGSIIKFFRIKSLKIEDIQENRWLIINSIIHTRRPGYIDYLKENGFTIYDDPWDSIYDKYILEYLDIMVKNSYNPERPETQQSWINTREYVINNLMSNNKDDEE